MWWCELVTAALREVEAGGSRVEGWGSSDGPAGKGTFATKPDQTEFNSQDLLVERESTPKDCPVPFTHVPKDTHTQKQELKVFFSYI